MIITQQTTMPPRQQACLEAITAWWMAYGESPTRTELGRALGITAVSAHLLVCKLAAAGLVVVAPKTWRNIEIA